MTGLILKIAATCVIMTVAFGFVLMTTNRADIERIAYILFNVAIAGVVSSALALVWVA